MGTSTRTGRALRVLQLIKGLRRGGAEVLLAETCKRMPRRDYQIAVGYFLPDAAMMARDLAAQGHEVHCFGAPTAAAMFRTIPRVGRFISRWRPDVVHCHLPLAGVVGRLAAGAAGARVVYTEHNVLERYHPLTRASSLATWPLQRQVIAVSQEVAASISRVAGDRVPVSVVRNAVIVEHFEPQQEALAAVRRSLGIPPGAPVVGTVAVFRPAKRLDLWLAAAKQVLGAVPDAHFIIVGYGPLEREVHEGVSALGLGQRVHLAGAQSDVRPFLAAMDVFLMSSDFEGLPIALLEAMAMRLPVVATAVGGIPETVIHGETGWLSSPGDVDHLARKTATLLLQPAQRASFAEAARQRVDGSFGMERMLSEIADVYDRALT